MTSVEFRKLMDRKNLEARIAALEGQMTMLLATNVVASVQTADWRQEMTADIDRMMDITNAQIRGSGLKDGDLECALKENVIAFCRVRLILDTMKPELSKLLDAERKGGAR